MASSACSAARFHAAAHTEATIADIGSDKSGASGTSPAAPAACSRIHAATSPIRTPACFCTDRTVTLSPRATSTP